MLAVGYCTAGEVSISIDCSSLTEVRSIKSPKVAR
jgi:hypothetical protein